MRVWLQIIMKSQIPLLILIKRQGEGGMRRGWVYH
jgi:hypothetical protein